MMKYILILLCSLFLFSCENKVTIKYAAPKTNSNTTFSEIPSSFSGISFNNKISEENLPSTFEYVNVYNGGGVAIGDINNDGFEDIYFTGNQVENKLYLNKGGFAFEDIAISAGVSSPNSWSTGAIMFDFNNDGFKDIYVCNSFHENPKNRENQLYINNGDLTFTESAADYGLNDSGYSIMASVFDYDKDGKVDILVGNHPQILYKSYEEHFENWSTPSLETSNQLYRNTGKEFFQNTTTKAGLVSYGWTLGMVTVDLNQDNWPDIYVTVDHNEPDRFYINNKNGTFREASINGFEHISLSSMGVDAGDVNNDGLTDLITVEMLSEDSYRSKTQMRSMNVARFWDLVKKGHNYQYMRNMLHLNNGNETFRETGQMAGIDKTDWSWASLFMDMDNDGWQDVYISNGYYRDVANQDYRVDFNKKLNELSLQQNETAIKSLFHDHGKNLSSTKLENYAFKNILGNNFENFSEESGLNYSGFSNGAAYADFDLDGDLDLVVNNLNDIASLYSNNSVEKGNSNWLEVVLTPGEDRVSTLNTKIFVETENNKQFKEHTLTRGYQSAVSDVVHFGLGNASEIKKVKIQWPDGKEQVFNNTPSNTRLAVSYKNAESLSTGTTETKKSLFTNVATNQGIVFNHVEQYYDDYATQVLLPHQMSCFGPALANADVNNDGLEDIFIGGAQKQIGALYIQQQNGTFFKSDDSFLTEDSFREDLAAAFFDIDNDGDLDLYVASGGNEMPNRNDYYTDRLYVNDGTGKFKKSTNLIPKITESGGCVKPYDFDNDGDTDLFLGNRHIPGKYPFAPKSYLLENKNGKLVDVTKEKAPHLMEVGMVTDAIWTDFNNDTTLDLVIVGEWMPITVLLNKDNKLINNTEALGLKNTRGWWNTIEEGDFDKDGISEYVVGNLGTNYKYRVSDKKGFHIYGGDFDSNGSSDIVLSYDKGEYQLPIRGRECSSQQVPGITTVFPTYDSFAKATLQEIYGEKLNNALHYSIDSFKSSILKKEKNGSWLLQPLPTEAQSSPINDIIIKDFDKDGIDDILVAGNLLNAEVETGRADAGIGCFLKGQKDGSFSPKFYNETGFFARDDVKKLVEIKTRLNDFILVVRNNGPIQMVR